MRKFSLLFAAALMAFAVQTAWAEDDISPEEQQLEELAEAADYGDDDGSFVERWRGRRGDFGATPRMGRWHGGPGRGPAMMPHRGAPGMGFGPHGMHPGMGMGMFGPRFMEELELTDAQKTQLVDVMTENFRNGLLARIEMQDAIAKLRELNESDAPDHDAIIAANAAVGAARGKLDVLGRKAKDQFRSVLTEEQIKKLDEFKDKARGEWRKDRRDRRERRDGRPGPRDPRMQRGPGPRVVD